MSSRTVCLDGFDRPVKRIWLRRGESLWVLDLSDTPVESHHPMDRVGGPYYITAWAEDEYGKSTERYFLATVVNCWFPVTDLVRGDSLEDAYESYLAWAATNRHLKIEDDELGDYTDEDTQEIHAEWSDDAQCWVDPENVHLDEVEIEKIEFAD